MFRYLQKLALLVMAVVVVQPFCPALLLSTVAPATSATDPSDCHDSIPAVPAAPVPAKKCCVAGHSQIAIPALRFASTPPSVAEWHVSQSVGSLFESHFDPSVLFAASRPQPSPPILRI